MGLEAITNIVYPVLKLSYYAFPPKLNLIVNKDPYIGGFPVLRAWLAKSHKFSRCQRAARVWRTNPGPCHDDDVGGNDE